MTNKLLPTIVVATRNRGKLREFQSLLRPLDNDVLSLADISIVEDCEETGQTFAENARQKSIFYSKLVPFPVLADDSGLEVDALGGRPGVHSARFAGAEASDSDRVQKLLKELAAVGGRREARFVCSLALARSGAVLCESEGHCPGTIADEPRGSNGFGYDPVFFFPHLGKTMAELGEDKKNKISHRARAVASLLKILQMTEIINRKS